MASTRVLNNLNLSLCDKSKPSIGLRELYNKRQLSHQEIEDESEHVKADNADKREESIHFQLRASYKYIEADSDDAQEESIDFLLNQSSHNQIFLASDLFHQISSISESEIGIKTSSKEQSYKRKGQQNLLKKLLFKRGLKKNSNKRRKKRCEYIPRSYVN